MVSYSDEFGHPKHLPVLKEMVPMVQVKAGTKLHLISISKSNLLREKSMAKAIVSNHLRSRPPPPRQETK